MKYLFTFFLSLVLGSTISVLKFSPASAVSSSTVIMQLQTAGAVSNTSSEEIIVLYNLSVSDLNITGWCLEYSSGANGVTFTKLSCVDTADAQTELWVKSGGYVSFGTNEFKTKNFTPDFLFNAGLAATGGHLRLVDSSGLEIDRVSWGNAVAIAGVLPAIKHTDGKVLSRNTASLLLDTDVHLTDFSSMPLLTPIISGVYEVEILVDLCPNITGMQVDIPSGFMIDDSGDCYEDICPNIDDLQIIIPSGYEMKPGSFNCTLIPLEDAILLITELVANAPSTDTGREYIEIHNPLNRTVNLSGYKLQVGPNFTKEFIFANSDILAGQYKVFSDSETSIVLPNTTGVQLRLIAPDGNTVSETDVYSDAGDNVSWALVEDQWIYTNQITPGATNRPYLEPAQTEVVGVSIVMAPCPDGKYRNPETNRCRAIETAVSQLAACNEDEYRNPETNRCRKATAVSILVACGVGKVRNPETKRCRNIAQTTSLTDCTEGQERNPETNRCRKISVLGSSTDSLPTVTDVAVESTTGQINWAVIVGVLAGTFAYIVYEWRSELTQFYGRIRAKLVQ